MTHPRLCVRSQVLCIVRDSQNQPNFVYCLPGGRTVFLRCSVADETAVRLQMILTLAKVVTFQLPFLVSLGNLSQAAFSQVVGGLMLVVERDVNIL
jgi:small ligand-binding sensory domain FIST